MTAEKALPIFKKFVIKYAKEFSLMDYSLVFTIEDFDGEAGVSCSRNDSRAIFALNKKSTYTEIEIKEAAFHEVVELLLEELAGPMYEFYSNKYIQELTHRIVRRIENRENF